MTDRAILFSDPMVCALLAGIKSQTRRPLKPQPIAAKDMRSGIMPIYDGDWAWPISPGFIHVSNRQEPPADYLEAHPIYAVGDRFWVKEMWRAAPFWDSLKPTHIEHGAIWYEADGPHRNDRPGRVRSGRHMCRWMSRLTLHITQARVQRLQDISADDAAAEGLTYLNEGPGAGFWAVDGTSVCGEGSAEAYAQLWEYINGAGSWDKNPWIAAYTFSVEHANIGQARLAA